MRIPLLVANRGSRSGAVIHGHRPVRGVSLKVRSCTRGFYRTVTGAPNAVITIRPYAVSGAAKLTLYRSVAITRFHAGLFCAHSPARRER